MFMLGLSISVKDRAVLDALCRELEIIIEPSRGKTNNVVSEQVPHKLACTVTEDS